MANLFGLYVGQDTTEALDQARPISQSNTYMVSIGRLSRGKEGTGVSAYSGADVLSARLSRIGQYKTRALGLALNEDELSLGDPRRL